MNVLRQAARTASTTARARAGPPALRLYSSSARICSSCSTPLPTALPTCPNCSHIEPLPSTISYFDVLGLPSSQSRFNLNARDLRARFLQTQRVCHPDAWSRKGEKEQAIAAEQSSLVNAAYKTLQSPVLRAQYILSQEGHPPSETDKLTDQELIMEVMEAREELEEATSPQVVEQIRAKNEAKLDEVCSETERLLEAKRWEEAGEAVVKLKYLEGIETAAKEKLQHLLI